MYIVVSKWEVIEGKEQEWEQNGKAIRDRLRATPGVEVLHTFTCGERERIAVVGYSDRETYDRIINDPEGPFMKAVQETNIENSSRWLWSERGEEFQ